MLEMVTSALSEHQLNTLHQVDFDIHKVIVNTGNNLVHQIRQNMEIKK